MSDYVPDPSFSTVKNAARLAMFAEAAYLQDADKHGSRRTRFQEQLEGNVIWWSHESCHGVLYVDQQDVCIGVATQASLTEVVSGTDTSELLGNWSEATGIPVPSDANQAVTLARFLARTRSTYMGVERALHEHFCLNLAELSKPMWMAGHHLGGAIVQLLQCTTLFSHARAFAFGSPKVFEKNTIPPARLRVRVSRLSDPAPHLPAGYGHASAETLYASHPGCVTTSIPWLGGPIAVIQAVSRWLGKSVECELTGHSVAHYVTDLRPLR